MREVSNKHDQEYKLRFSCIKIPNDSKGKDEMHGVKKKKWGRFQRLMLLFGFNCVDISPVDFPIAPDSGFW